MTIRIGSILQDIRYVFRQIRRSPGFAVTIVLTVGLAVGANAALFSMVDSVMLRPLHCPNPEQVVMLWTGDPAHGQLYSMSYPQFEAFRDHDRSFSEVAAYDDESITFSNGGDPEKVVGGRISHRFFTLLGAHPVLGRSFTAEEDSPGGAPVAMISHAAWTNRYHNDPGVIGKPIQVDGSPFTIVGVVEKNFDFLGEPVEVWRPRMFETRSATPAGVRAGAAYLTLIARLKPGVSLEQARAAVAVIDAADRQARPARDPRNAIRIDLLSNQVFMVVRSGLWVLWGAVLCVLLIACANVANLMMSRAWTRRAEVAARVALGASYGRIAQQLLVESVALATIGGVIALPVARVALVWLVGLVRETTPQVPDVHLNASVMILAMIVCTGAGLLFGLAPIALLLSGVSESLIGKERAVTESRTVKFWRSSFVTSQIALSIVLLAGAGLLIRSFNAMRGLSTGLRSNRVIVQPLSLMAERYDKNEARNAFYNETLRRVQSLPGVDGAAISSRVSLVQSGLGYGIRVAGEPIDPAHAASARGRSISAGYLDLLGIPLVAGRGLDAHDTAGAAPVMLVNEKFARVHFPGPNPARSALGKRVTYSNEDITCQIVGVVRDVRLAVASTGIDEEIYLPLEQRPYLSAYLVVRASGDAGALGPAVRSELQRIDREQAVADSRTLNWMIDHRYARPQNTMTVLGAFAGAALLLAALGIYGLQAYSVAQRSREIGIRMALGAAPARVLLGVLGESARLAAIGLLIGLPSAFALARLYESMLFQVTPGDPLTVLAVLAGLATLVVGSTYLPARRASRVDPAIVLRSE